MRESWTDERLDDFRDDVNRRFDDVDRRFDKVDGEISDLRSEMRSGFDGVNRRFDEFNGRFAAGHEWRYRPNSTQRG